MAFMRWLNQFLRPYLRDRLRPLLDEAAEAAVAPHAAASIKGMGGHAGMMGVKQAKCIFTC